MEFFTSISIQPAQMLTTINKSIVIDKRIIILNEMQVEIIVDLNDMASRRFSFARILNELEFQTHSMVFYLKRQQVIELSSTFC